MPQKQLKKLPKVCETLANCQKYVANLSNLTKILKKRRKTRQNFAQTVEKSINRPTTTHPRLYTWRTSPRTAPLSSPAACGWRSRRGPVCRSRRRPSCTPPRPRWGRGCGRRCPSSWTAPSLRHNRKNNPLTIISRIIGASPCSYRLRGAAAWARSGWRTRRGRGGRSCPCRRRSRGRRGARRTCSTGRPRSVGENTFRCFFFRFFFTTPLSRMLCYF